MTGFDCRDKTGVYGQSLTNQGDLAATLEITSVSDKILEFFSGFMEFLSSKFCLLFSLFLKDQCSGNNYGELLFHVKLHLAQ